MGQQRVRRLLEACGLSPDAAPDLESWQAFLRTIEQEHLTQALERRERYLDAIVEMQRRLLRTKTTNKLGALNHVLEPLAEAADASRVYLFENYKDHEGELFMNQLAEWCAPGIAPELDNPELQNVPYAEFFPRWESEMKHGRSISGLVRDLPDSEREFLEVQDILSILVIPYEVEGEFMGFVGFDHCQEPRAWEDLEVRLLSAAAGNIGLMLDQRRTSRLLEKAHDALEDARDRALEASQAKSEFLAKVSHELRTPLTGVIGYAELLIEVLEEEDAEPSWISDVSQIHRAGQHLLAVISDLLDLSRVEAGKLTVHAREFDANRLLEDVVRMVEPMRSWHDNAFEHTHEPLGTVYTDETRLGQILLNLLSNAFKYTDHGNVWLRARSEGDALVFEVQDTGIGMNEEQQEQMFEAFIQADNSHARVFEGTGLGLTITRHLCEALGAELTLSSAPGEGSTFTVTLPRTYQEHDQARLHLFH